MGWISLSGPHPRSQHPTSLAEALGEVPLEVLANEFNSMALLRKRTTRARTRAEHGSPRPHWVTKLKAEPPCISSWTLYHGCTGSPKSFHCSQGDQETKRIVYGYAKLEDWP